MRASTFFVILSPMQLTAIVREKLGKSVRALRRDGLIPAELYGRGIPNVHLAVKEREFTKAIKGHGESQMFELAIDKAKHPVMVNDIQRDYLTGEVVHVDFYAVRMDESIRAKVPLHFTGESPAVKNLGGFLNKTLAEIEIESLPADIPASFSVALDGLTELAQSIYVRDIAVPPRVKILVNPETVVVTVTPPRAEEEIPAAPVDISAVKVESEEKKAERAAEKSKQEEVTP